MFSFQSLVCVVLAVYVLRVLYILGHNGVSFVSGEVYDACVSRAVLQSVACLDTS